MAEKRFVVGQRVLTSTGTATVVRGPYTKYGQEWYDIVQPNDFGEPGQYSHAYRTDQLRPEED